MAKKVVAQELCLFCGESPCDCTPTVLRSKVLREKHGNPTRKSNVRKEEAAADSGEEP